MTSQYNRPSWQTGMVRLSEGVYAFLQSKGSWGWSNAGLIEGEKYAAVVDTLLTVPLTEAFLKEVRDVTNKALRYLIITHHHGDHCDTEAIKLLRGDDTKIVYTKLCATSIKGGLVMKNGDVKTVDGLKIEAFPAYNLVHMRDSGQPFHPKGEGNGYKSPSVTSRSTSAGTPRTRRR